MDRPTDLVRLRCRHMAPISLLHPRPMACGNQQAVPQPRLFRHEKRRLPACLQQAAPQHGHVHYNACGLWPAWLPDVAAPRARRLQVDVHLFTRLTLPVTGILGELATASWAVGVALFQPGWDGTGRAALTRPSPPPCPPQPRAPATAEFANSAAMHLASRLQVTPTPPTWALRSPRTWRQRSRASPAMRAACPPDGPASTPTWGPSEPLALRSRCCRMSWLVALGQKMEGRPASCFN